MTEEVYKAQIAQIQHEYDKAYYRWLFCPDNQKTEAKWFLDIWRSKFFSF
jgi:hypothetical protein